MSSPSKGHTAVWVQDTPYICLGCESGLLLSLQLLIDSGEPAEGICQAVNLEVLVYECELRPLDHSYTQWVPVIPQRQIYVNSLIQIKF